jgi:hypothetical protein
MRLRHPKFTIFSIIIGVILLFWLASIFLDPHYNQDVIYGTSFDPENAGSLHLDTKKTFDAIINVWKFKYLRFPIHWDKLEKARGQFDFTEVDYFMNEAAKSGVKVTLAIGHKTPRWPECHTPNWTQNFSEADYYQAINEYFEAVVLHYRNHPALEIWQVENEPFLNFGGCPKMTAVQLQQELNIVKKLDPAHPTLVTDSGELSMWNKTANLGDYFGTTLYRVVWSPVLGYWSYDWVPSFYYRLKLFLVGRTPVNSFVSELQAEPWPPNMGLAQTSYEEQQKSMDISRLKKNINFAHQVGFSRMYLWGAEWWYWLKVHGYNEIPDYISTLNR